MDMKPVAKITVRRGLEDEQFDLGSLPTLVITTSSGAELHIELFERRPGEIQILTMGHGGRLVVIPASGNAISITAEKR